MTGLWITVTAFLFIILAITCLNTYTFPRLGRSGPRSGSAQPATFVSILVPARNEANVIGQTIRDLLSQDYPGYEVLLLDDNSSDKTADLARAAAGQDGRFRLLTGQALPPGWLGKNWACWQLAGQAQGELLIFADADVHWRPTALADVVKSMYDYQADMLTVWPTQQTSSWAERLVVPMMMFVVMGYLPEIFVRMVSWSVFAAANGQCLAFRKSAYEKIGGHATVRAEIVEDVSLAHQTKRKGLRLVMSLGNHLIWGRMYENWRTVRLGFGKNILAGYGGRPILLIVSAILHWAVFIAPWLWLAVGGSLGLGVGWPAWPLGLIFTAIFIRWLSARETSFIPVSSQPIGTDQPARPSKPPYQRAIFPMALDAIFLPASVLLMTVISGQALWWHYFQGGPSWKGRQIKRGSP